MHAFHVTVPPHARTLRLTFDYLPPHAEAALRPQMADVQWQRLLLYPAGWYTRDLPVAAKLRLPAELHPFTALTQIAR